MTKSGVKGPYSTVIEALSYLIQFKINGANSIDYINSYGRSPQHTYEMKKQTYDENSKSSTNTAVEDINFTDNCRFRICRVNQPRGYKSHWRVRYKNRSEIEPKKKLSVVSIALTDCRVSKYPYPS